MSSLILRWTCYGLIMFFSFSFLRFFSFPLHHCAFEYCTDYFKLSLCEGTRYSSILQVLAGAGACPLKSEIPSVQASTVSGMFSAAFTGHGAAPSNWIAVYSLHCLVSALWPLSIQTP